MIPFAGFLLEYPAAYVPECASHAALFDISLDVYEYNLITTDERSVWCNATLFNQHLTGLLVSL
jgi:hypothetical protein